MIIQPLFIYERIMAQGKTQGDVSPLDCLLVYIKLYDRVSSPLVGYRLPWIPERWHHQTWLAVQGQHEQRHQRHDEGETVFRVI